MPFMKQLELVGKIILTIILIVLAFHYFTTPQPWTVIDGTNLLVHEAGHLLFTWAGEFIMFLGGTIFQIVVPLIFTIYFVYRQEWFSSFFGIYWTGINLINIGIYIADASAMNLPLIHQGSQHDWNYLLTQTQLLGADQLLGNLVRGLGSIGLALALVLMLYEVWNQILTSQHQSSDSFN